MVERSAPVNKAIAGDWNCSHQWSQSFCLVKGLSLGFPNSPRPERNSLQPQEKKTRLNQELKIIAFIGKYTVLQEYLAIEILFKSWRPGPEFMTATSKHLTEVMSFRSLQAFTVGDVSICSVTADDAFCEAEPRPFQSFKGWQRCVFGEATAPQHAYAVNNSSCHRLFIVSNQTVRSTDP